MTKEHKIVVMVQPSYLAAQSNPESHRFLWSYEVTITNNSDEVIQLLNRYWRITDMSGKVEEVKGPGVIGLQPIIKPEKSFSYSSFCQLVTPQGTMEGHYEMQNLEEKKFVVEIPKFILNAPGGISSSFRSKLH